MTDVASLGSINIDFVSSVSTAEVEVFEREYEWFPSLGETKHRRSVPESLQQRTFEHLFGGKGANQALAARRAGVDASLFGKVGTDHAEHGVLSVLRHD